MAYEFEGTRYDVGNKLGFICASIDLALQRDELQETLLQYMEHKLQEYYRLVK